MMHFPTVARTLPPSSKVSTSEPLHVAHESELIHAPTEQMAAALLAVRQIIGSEADSGIGDTKIMDTLWNYYFDVEECVRWLLGLSPDFAQSRLLSCSDDPSRGSRACQCRQRTQR